MLSNFVSVKANIFILFAFMNWWISSILFSVVRLFTFIWDTENSLISDGPGFVSIPLIMSSLFVFFVEPSRDHCLFETLFMLYRWGIKTMWMRKKAAGIVRDFPVCSGVSGVALISGSGGGRSAVGGDLVITEGEVCRVGRTSSHGEAATTGVR